MPKEYTLIVMLPYSWQKRTKDMLFALSQPEPAAGAAKIPRYINRECTQRLGTVYANGRKLASD